MRSRFILCLSALLFLLPAVSSFAGEYGYSPSLSLGHGFNPYEPDNYFLPCFDISKPSMEKSKAYDTVIAMEMISSRKDFYRLTKFSTSLSASKFFFKGSGELSYEDELDFHSDSLNWIIMFRTDYGKRGYSKVSFYPEILEMNSDDIYTRCGPEIVTAVRKEVMIYALLSVKHLSEKQRTALETKFSGKYGGAYSVASTYSSLINSGLAASQITVRIRAIGGTGISDMTDILIDKKAENSDEYINYANLPSVMHDQIKKMTLNNAVSTAFYTSSLKSLIPTKVRPKYENFKHGEISSLYVMYLDYNKMYDKIYGILSGTLAINKKQETLLKEAQQVCSTEMARIKEIAKSCFEDNSNLCILPPTNFPKISWTDFIPKTPTINLCEKARRVALDKKIISREQYLQLIKINQGPIFKGQLAGRMDNLTQTVELYLSCDKYPAVFY